MTFQHVRLLFSSWRETLKSSAQAEKNKENTVRRNLTLLSPCTRSGEIEPIGSTKRVSVPKEKAKDCIIPE